MVYRENLSGKWELIQNKALRYRIIAALREVWPDNPGGWPELLLDPEDMGDNA